MHNDLVACPTASGMNTKEATRQCGCGCSRAGSSGDFRGSDAAAVDAHKTNHSYTSGRAGSSGGGAVSDNSNGGDEAAFSGPGRAFILDEPTAGLDPLACRY